MKIFLYVSHGFHVRNLLDSRLLDRLQTVADVVILVSQADLEHCRADYAGNRVSVEPILLERRVIDALFEIVRKRIVIKPNRALTTSLFSDHERRTQPIRHAFERVLHKSLGRWRLVRQAWLAFERLLVPGREFDSVFARLQPDLVVTANYGTDPSTIRLLRAARRHRIPSLAIVPSFDNLTSKGVIGAPMSRLIVWNEIMRHEADDLHDIPRDQVAACGPIQFDIYADPSRWAKRDAVWRAHGLDPSRPTFVVGTITPVYFPYNTDVIELIAEAIQDGRLPSTAQILIRLHPQVVDDAHFGDNLDVYKQLVERYPFVKLNIPAVRRWKKLKPPAKDDMAILATILANAAAVVVPASTLAVDAAAVDTPIVGIGFDGKSHQPPELSVARYYDFTHYKPITRSGAVAVAGSREQLIDFLNEALQHRAARADKRRSLVNTMIERHDGHAVDRIMAEIESMLPSRSGSHVALKYG